MVNENGQVGLTSGEAEWAGRLAMPLASITLSFPRAEVGRAFVAKERITFAVSHCRRPVHLPTPQDLPQVVGLRPR